MTPRCGHPMRLARAHCARPKDHPGPHRSPYDLDNRRYMRTGRWPMDDKPSEPPNRGATVPLTAKAEALVAAGVDIQLHIEASGHKSSEGDGITARDLELQQMYGCTTLPCEWPHDTYPVPSHRRA